MVKEVRKILSLALAMIMLFSSFSIEVGYAEDTNEKIESGVTEETSSDNIEDDSQTQIFEVDKEITQFPEDEASNEIEKSEVSIDVQNYYNIEESITKIDPPSDEIMIVQENNGDIVVKSNENSPEFMSWIKGIASLQGNVLKFFIVGETSYVFDAYLEYNDNLNPTTIIIKFSNIESLNVYKGEYSIQINSEGFNVYNGNISITKAKDVSANPEGIKVESEEKGIKISCNESVACHEWITKMYDGQTPGKTLMFLVNSSGIEKMIPMNGSSTPWFEDKLDNSIVLSKSKIIEAGIPAGNYSFKIKVEGYNNCTLTDLNLNDYGVKKLSASVQIEQLENKDLKISCIGSEDCASWISTVNRFTFVSPVSSFGGSGIQIPDSSEGNMLIKYEFLEMTGAQSGEYKLSIGSSGFENVETDPLFIIAGKETPKDLRLYINSDGVYIQTNDQEYLNLLLNKKANPNSMNVISFLEIHDVPGKFSESYDLSNTEDKPNRVTIKNINGKNYVHISLEDLINSGVKDSSTYQISLQPLNYAGRRFSYIRINDFKKLIDSFKNESNITVDELSELDKIASNLNLGESGISVEASIDNTTTAVDIKGIIAGALDDNDLSNLNESKITINTALKDIDLPANAIIENEVFDNKEFVMDKGFSITTTKSLNESQSNEVKNSSIKTVVEIDKDSISQFNSNEQYHLISEHKNDQGVMEYYSTPLTLKDGKLFAYVDQFSNFYVSKEKESSSLETIYQDISVVQDENGNIVISSKSNNTKTLEWIKGIQKYNTSYTKVLLSGTKTYGLDDVLDYDDITAPTKITISLEDLIAKNVVKGEYKIFIKSQNYDDFSNDITISKGIELSTLPSTIALNSNDKGITISCEVSNNCKNWINDIDSGQNNWKTDLVFNKKINDQVVGFSRLPLPGYQGEWFIEKSDYSITLPKKHIFDAGLDAGNYIITIETENFPTYKNENLEVIDYGVKDITADLNVEQLDSKDVKISCSKNDSCSDWINNLFMINFMSDNGYNYGFGDGTPIKFASEGYFILSREWLTFSGIAEGKYRINIEAKGFTTITSSEFTLDAGKTVPNDVEVFLNSKGLYIYSTDEDYLKAIVNSSVENEDFSRKVIVLNEYLKNPGQNPSFTGISNTIKDNQKIKIIEENGKKYAFVDLETLVNSGIKDEAVYSINIYPSPYAAKQFSSLRVRGFKALIDALVGSNTNNVTELKELDEIASGLKLGNTGINVESSMQNLTSNVEVVGLTVGSIESSELAIKGKTDVKIASTIDKITTKEVPEKLAQDGNILENTGFSIVTNKTVNEGSTVEVKETNVDVAIKVDLNNLTKADDEEFVLYSVHEDGDTKEYLTYSLDVNGNSGTAYVDKFSDFYIGTKKIASKPTQLPIIEKPSTSPAPIVNNIDENGRKTLDSIGNNENKTSNNSTVKSLISGVETDNALDISVNMQFNKENSESLEKINVIINSDELVKQVLESDKSEVNINIPLPNGISLEQLNEVMIQHDLFNVAKQNNKNLSFSFTDSTGKQLIKWSFKAIDITDTSIDLNLATLFNKESVPNEKNVYVITFKHDGPLPGKATVEVDVSDYSGDNELLDFYYYNKDTGKNELISENINPINGKAITEVEHCSTYFFRKKITNQEVDPTTNVKTSIQNLNDGIILLCFGVGCVALVIIGICVIRIKKRNLNK
ncbi:MAG: carboxypeptidase-like regulatory domain-containing protein [Erysipelotrichaceae bacterium]